VLVKWRRFFNLLAAQQGKSGMDALEQKLELEQLKVRIAWSNTQSRDVTEVKQIPSY
jgi:hypothetical protein